MNNLEKTIHRILADHGLTPEADSLIFEIEIGTFAVTAAKALPRKTGGPLPSSRPLALSSGRSGGAKVVKVPILATRIPAKSGAVKAVTYAVLVALSAQDLADRPSTPRGADTTTRQPDRPLALSNGCKPYLERIHQRDSVPRLLPQTSPAPVAQAPAKRLRQGTCASA